MKNQPNLSTNEKDAILKEAYEEKPFTANDLIEEIAPLIEDYFEGEFVKEANEIILSFYNGQKFRLTVTKL